MTWPQVVFCSGRRSLSCQPRLIPLLLNQVYRSCNMVVHELARVGRGRDPDHLVFWMHPLPAFVNNFSQ